MLFFTLLISNFNLIANLKFPKIKIFFLSSLNSILDVFTISIFGLFVSAVLSNKNFLVILSYTFSIDSFIKFFLLIVFLKLIYSFFFLYYLKYANKIALNNFLDQVKIKSYDDPNLYNKDSNIEFRLASTDIRHLLPAIIMPIVSFFSDTLIILMVITVTIFQYKFVGFLGSLIFILISIFFLNYARKSISNKNISEVSDKLISLYSFYFKNKFFLSTTNSKDRFANIISESEEYVSDILSSIQFRKSIFRPSIEFLVMFVGLMIIFFELSEFFLIFLLIIRAIPSILNIANMLFNQNIYSKISIDFLNLIRTSKHQSSFFSQNENTKPLFKYNKIKGLNLKNGQEIIIRSNVINCITGSSGSGKTTLLNEISGIFPNKFWNFEVFDNDELISKNIKIFKHDIVYMPQDFDDSNLLLYELLNSLGIKNENFIEKCQELFPNLNNDSINRALNTFSGGEKQRIYFICSFILKKNIFLFDEPTSGLEKAKSMEVFNLLNKIKKQSLIILVSHDENIINNSENIILI